jgi:purine-nucleoside phosphorylase
MLRDMTRSDWLSWLDLEPVLIPHALVLRGTRNLKRHYAAHRSHFADVVDLGSPNGLFEDVFIGRLGEIRVAYASVYGAPMASEIAHVFGVLGTRLVIQTGCCGALADELATGDLFLASEAFCGEGAAQYYRSDAAVRASIGADLWRSLPSAAGVRLRFGRIYTTAALLAEGDAELAAWHADGFAAVDMETAATFAVAEHFGMDRASILFVFDNPRRKDHMLLLDGAKDRCRDAANGQMIDLALAMIRVHAAHAASTNPQPAHPRKPGP